MSAERYARLKEIFGQATELTLAERASFLENACAGDAELLAEVEKLLDFEADEPTFLEPPSSQLVLQRLQDRIGKESRYQIRGEFARGGMGAILRVWDKDLRRTLAMKVVLGRDSVRTGDTPGVDERSLGRFLEEAQVTGQLDHPGIVPVHELGVDPEGRAYFTMRLVKGIELREVFGLVLRNEDAWTRTRALGALLKVCETMAYAHSKGVIHRDLKPANVMVGKFGEVYVMDWGLARILDREETKDIRLRTSDLQTESIRSDRKDDSDQVQDSPLVTMDGDVVGTPSYMAPEQAAGKISEVGPRSDVYSVGAILYHLLSGYAPYVPPDSKIKVHTVLGLVLHGPPKPIQEMQPDVPAELQAICEQAMARDPADRYPNMAAMSADLQAYLEGRVVRAYRTGAIVELRKWVQRNKGLAAALVALVVALALGAGTSSYFLRETTLTLREVQRLSDLHSLSFLREEAERELWPARPSKVAAMETWLADAESLVGRLDEHREYRAQLALDTKANAVELERQDTFLSGLLAFTDRIEDVTARHRFASTVRRLSIGDRIDAWNEAIAAISNRQENPQYDGLAIEPQIGLVPLGRDPDSGLFEFGHLLTGSVPERDADGRLVLTEATGLVFVLIPGGSFRRVVRSEKAQSPSDGESALDGASPGHEVRLSAFFFAKYEMTQGQWLRLTGENPSAYGPDGDWNRAWLASGESASLLHPVEQVSWFDCDEWMRRAGLSLPSEARWEYGARGGAETLFAFGDDPASLKGAANVRDEYFERTPDLETWAGCQKDFDDGSSVHWPVGSGRANGFGLHDVHGNVWEWCLDDYVPLAEGDSQAPEVDPVAEGTRDERRVYRGGGFRHLPLAGSMTARWFDPPGSSGSARGLRPAREISD